MGPLAKFRMAVLMAVPLLPGALTLCGQSVLARAEANPSVVMIGESSTYSIRFLNTDSIPNLMTPRVTGLEFNPTPSTSSYRQIINGKVSIETEISWSFRPAETGTFVIPGRTLEIRGEELTIPAVEVKAVPMDEETRSRALLVLEIPEGPVYIGQALPSRLSLLVRRDLNISSIEFPQGEGDAFQHSEFSKNPVRGTVQYQGRSYNALVWNILITPIKSGPAELRFKQNLALQVIDRNGRFPSIFSMASTRTEAVTATTEPLARDILQLPRENQPEAFSGAIGSFEVNTRLQSKDLKVGEPVTLQLTLTGEGNFERITLPDLPQWDDWRIYPPKVEFSPEDELGFKGSKSFEFILIPQSTDLTEVPPLPFASFDPDTREYVSHSAEAVAVTVAESDLPATEGPLIAINGNQESVQPSAPEKILPLKPAAGKLLISSEPLWQSPRFQILNGLTGLSLMATALWLLRRKRRLTDHRLARRHTGSRKVRKALASAQKAAAKGDAGAFLEAARYALQESICHLSNRPVEAKTLVSSECLNILRTHGVNDALLAKVENLLHQADACQFAGASPGADALSSLIKDLASALSELNRVIK